MLECRQFAGNDRDAFAYCLNSWRMPTPGETMPILAGPPGPRTQGAVWYDDSGLPWQVEVSGANFTAQADVPGLGRIRIIGRVIGVSLSYQLRDVAGNAVGYGEGSFDDATHISYISYLPNGVPFASGQLHVNHAPN